MGFRFSKRITIVPGVRLNISGSGVRTSIGPRGLSITTARCGGAGQWQADIQEPHRCTDAQVRRGQSEWLAQT